MNVVEFDFEERVCAFVAGNYAIAPNKSKLRLLFNQTSLIIIN